MNLTSTSTIHVRLSLRELIADLKIAHPRAWEIQQLPVDGKGCVIDSNQTAMAVIYTRDPKRVEDV